MLKMKLSITGALSLLMVADNRGARAMRCEAKEGQKVWEHVCDHPTCEYTYEDWCQLREGEDPFPHKCIPKEDFRPFAEHCIKDDCDTTYSGFCTLNNTGGAPPSTTTSTEAVSSSSSSSSSSAASSSSSSSASTAAPTTSTTTNRDSHELCLSLAAKATIPGIDASCKDEVLMSHCASLHSGKCQEDDSCVLGLVRAFVQAVGGTWEEDASPSPSPSSSTSPIGSSSSSAGTTSTTTNSDSHELCLSLAAKATMPGIDALCSDELAISLCNSTYTGKCQGDDSCVSDSLRAFVQAVGGTWEENSSPSPAPSSSTSSISSSSSSAASSSSSSSASTSSPPGGPIDPDYIPFEHNITPRDLASIVPWGVSNYMGKSEFAGAQLLHSQIVEAIRNGPPEFKEFCGTGDLEKDRRECAAFFANVCKETGGLGAFEEATGDTYCTHLGDGDEGLQSEGEDFPCCLQEDKTTVCTDMGNCPYGCRMHGRGAIQLTWNFNYGRFSEFYYGDKETLLRNPDMVEPQGPSGWAASIWFWMTPQKYGGACPPPKDFSFDMPKGTQSCHDAMHDPEGGGFGQTIRIINGGYEACPKSEVAMSAIHRVRYYLFTATDWGVSPAEGCSVGQVDCDVSGVEFYTSSEGRIGNPQIGFKQNAEHCPNCGVPKCTDTRANKWLCGGSGDETCQDPVNALDPTCDRDSSAPSAHPAPWE